MQRRRYSHAYQRRRYPHTPLWLSLPVFLSARSEAPASAPVARRPRSHPRVTRTGHARAIRPGRARTRPGERDVFCLTERAPSGAGGGARARGRGRATEFEGCTAVRSVRQAVLRNSKAVLRSVHSRAALAHGAADARNRTAYTRARVRWTSVGCSVCAVCSGSPQPSLRRTASQPSQTTARRASLTALGRATDTRAPRWRICSALTSPALR